MDHDGQVLKFRCHMIPVKMYILECDEEKCLIIQPFPSEYYNSSEWYAEIVEHVQSGGIIINK